MLMVCGCELGDEMKEVRARMGAEAEAAGDRMNEQINK